MSHHFPRFKLATRNFSLAAAKKKGKLTKIDTHEADA